VTDWDGKYLIRAPDKKWKRKGWKTCAHLWDGADTVCRMWSTGGVSKHKSSVQDSDMGLPICSMCSNVWRSQNRESEAEQLGERIARDRDDPPWDVEAAPSKPPDPAFAQALRDARDIREWTDGPKPAPWRIHRLAKALMGDV
jgi:hypothetical protein